MTLMRVSLLAISLITFLSAAEGQETPTDTPNHGKLTEPYAVCDGLSGNTTACLFSCTYRRRVEGVPCLIPPKPTYSPEPEYTDKARKKRVSGHVLLKVTVDNTGQVTAVEVAEKLEPSLDKESKDTARTWKFEPATLEGKRVAVVLPVEMTFNLR